jgi:Holliday junction DNA helicase RuvA
MIGRLRGLIVEKATESVVLEVSGVGYVVAITPRTLIELPGVGEEAVLHTHLHVREDQMALYGFETVADRDLFDLLLGISGVGPKVALAICATFTTNELRTIVGAGDLASLTTVQGIGKRSAEKLMVELRPKLEAGGEPATAGSGPLSEARAALEGLGYAPDEIRGTLSRLPTDLPVEELVKRSLQHLGRQKT